MRHSRGELRLIQRNAECLIVWRSTNAHLRMFGMGRCMKAKRKRKQIHICITGKQQII